MTSNAGASTINKPKVIGFAKNSYSENNEYEKMKENIMAELKHTFRPEFLNRIDEIIVFHKLQKEDLTKIVDIMLEALSEKLKEQDITISFSEEAKKYLTKEGFDEEFGARPLRRAITKTIEDKLSEEILKENVKKGDNIEVSVLEDELKFNRV